MTDGSEMKVVSSRMLPLEHSAIFLTCIKCIENRFVVFLRVVVLHRFNCVYDSPIQKYCAAVIQMRFTNTFKNKMKTCWGLKSK